jgi:3-phosphoglycerate kinase
MVEEDLVPMAAELMAKAKAQGVNFYLPTDVVIADKV